MRRHKRRLFWAGITGLFCELMWATYTRRPQWVQTPSRPSLAWLPEEWTGPPPDYPLSGAHWPDDYDVRSWS